MAAAAGPEVPRTEGAKPTAGGVIPFRRATTRRTALSIPSAGTVTAAQQPIQVTVEGTGYMTGIVIEVVVTTAGNGAATAYQPDAPWCAIPSIVLSDTSGEYVNVDGFGLYLQNKYMGQYTHATLDSATADTSIYSVTAGAGATGGSFNFFLRIPPAINDRNFLGLIGNQDRAYKLQLRDDFAPSASIYTVAPTNAGAIQINRFYESVSVPARQNAQGIAQAIYPPKWGVQHFITQTINPGSAPLGGSTVNHYLPRIGNTIRGFILVFRSNGSRATAEANMPTRISLLLGDTTLFTETTGYRRQIMRQKYGFDADAGVLVYDFTNDFLLSSGSEFGLDYLWTAGLVNMQFQITYPAGFGAANNSLIVITDDLIVPDGVNLYSPDNA